MASVTSPSRRLRLASQFGFNESGKPPEAVFKPPGAVNGLLAIQFVLKFGPRARRRGGAVFTWVLCYSTFSFNQKKISRLRTAAR